MWLFRDYIDLVLAYLFLNAAGIQIKQFLGYTINMNKYLSHSGALRFPNMGDNPGISLQNLIFLE